VDEELLPEVFDAGVFAALNMALDELRGPGPMMPVQGFARGGIASLKPLAREMAAAGRYGDTMIAHISPMEAQILRRYGGSGTINPRTGAPEFFLKNMFKKIGRAVKKFASSTVGKLVTTVALGFFLGPAAAGLIGASSPAAVAAVSGFVGSAGSTMLGGGNVKDALKAGAIGGLTAGATTAVFKGADAFKSVPKAGTASAAAAPATGTEMSLPELNAPAPATTFPASPNAAATLGRSPMPPPGGVESLVSKGATPGGGGSLASTGTPPGGGGSLVSTGTPPGGGGSLASTGTPAAPSAGVVNLGQYAPPSAGAPSTVANYLGQTSPQGFDIARAGAAPSAQQATNSMLDRIVPSRIRAAAEESAFKKVADKFKIPGGAEAVRSQLANNTASDAVVAAYAEASKVGLGQYLPMAGIGIAALGAMGGFEEEPVEVPARFEGMMEGEGAGSKLLEKYPERYGINLGPIQTLSSYPYTTPQRLFGAGAPQRAATGGIMSLDRYPRKNGHIAGPGTGTSDEIPAMLSDGEFVFTAKAVRAMGDGSRRKGAKRMYALMKKLEGRTNG